jgi:large repetitive protein
MQLQRSTISSIAGTGFPGAPTQPDLDCIPSDLSMTVTALPPNGTVLLADGFTPVRLQQALTLAELSGLKFKPALSSTAGSQCSDSSTTEQARSVVDDEAWLPAGYSILSVPQHSGARTIGIQICAAADSAASQSYAIITELPSNGIVLLADGTTSVVQGQTLTAAQLRRLRFRPAATAAGQISNLSFLMVHAAGSAAGCSLLIVRPAAPLTVRSAPVFSADSSRPPGSVAVHSIGAVLSKPP